MTKEDDLLCYKEIAHVLSLTERHVKRLGAKNKLGPKIPAGRTGVRYRLSDVLAYKEKSNVNQQIDFDDDMSGSMLAEYLARFKDYMKKGEDGELHCDCWKNPALQSLRPDCLHCSVLLCALVPGND